VLEGDAGFHGGRSDAKFNRSPETAGNTIRSSDAVDHRYSIHSTKIDGPRTPFLRLSVFG
jgi:hypothetical protein